MNTKTWFGDRGETGERLRLRQDTRSRLRAGRAFGNEVPTRSQRRCWAVEPPDQKTTSMVLPRLRPTASWAAGSATPNYSASDASRLQTKGRHLRWEGTASEENRRCNVTDRRAWVLLEEQLFHRGTGLRTRKTHGGRGPLPRDWRRPARREKRRGTPIACDGARRAAKLPKRERPDEVLERRGIGMRQRGSSSAEFGSANIRQVQTESRARSGRWPTRPPRAGMWLRRATQSIDFRYLDKGPKASGQKSA